MPNSVKKKWTLSVAPNPGGTLPPSVQALNNGTLHIFGQHAGSNATDQFNILSIKLINGVNPDFQFVSGVIDADNTLEFVFLSNGKENGDQFLFREGQHNGNLIAGGKIYGPPQSAGDEDIGTWSGTGGGGPDDDNDDNDDNAKCD
jgi:hypothetical protein